MKKTLTGSMAAKIAVFFGLAFSCLLLIGGAIVTVAMIEWNVYAYEGNRDTVIREAMTGQAWKDFRNIEFGSGSCVLNNLNWISDYCSGRNLDVKVETDTGDVLYRTYREDGVEETLFQYVYGFSAFQEKNEQNGQLTWALGRLELQSEDADESFGVPAGNGVVVPESTIIPQKNCIVTLYVDPAFPESDAYMGLAYEAGMAYELRYAAPAVAFVGLILCALCFIFLMCAAGRNNHAPGGSAQVLPGLLGGIPTDLLAALFLAPALIGLAVGSSFATGIRSTIAVVMIVGTLEAIWGTIFCMECAIRLKLHTFWSNTITWRAIIFGGRIFRASWKGCGEILRQIPLVLNLMIVFFGICIPEFFGMVVFGGSGELAVAWMFEKAVMLPAVVYLGWMCVQLKKGSEALAAGDLQYKIDTSRMAFGFREHGENLGKIAQGINAAVEQRMKSEHLKTELITNVSHDLKTPLTSIINYADLIASEAGAEGKVAEYSEVLLRQSRKLKKLLDDLLEVSKAATGNLEVDLAPCEIDVMLTQAVGEYARRFEDKGLKLITRQPEGAVRVMADGRHLWRVFDNLLNNICKYALEGSRVYLSVETKDGKVDIIFRNMSKYALEVSGEELEERFARGDKSRHLEGNGLGLSIAKSLMALQGGGMEIVTDGDLFKVALTFPML